MKYSKILIVLVIMTLIASPISFFLYKLKTTNTNELINITELSEEFMKEYFTGMQDLTEQGNEENILIVTSLDELPKDHGATKVVEGPNHQYFLQYQTEDEKEKAKQELKDVISIEENIVREITDYNSWGIEKIGLDYASELSTQYGENEITVAIIDTGCDMDLFNQYYSGKITETYNVLEPGSEMVDENGHGTHIAGTIAEATPDNVKILPMKVTDSKTIYISYVISAINYITYYEKADVINMSFSGTSFSDAEYQAIAAAKQKNIISIAAAGNDGVSTDNYPAAFDTTISIAAVDSTLEKAYYSNYGPTITFAAPGTSIVSINGTKSGTSMATPHAVSAVAILKTFNKDLTLENTIELLKKYAIDLGEDGYDSYYGYGLINFKGSSFCDGNNCDQYNVFKNINENLTITKIESPEKISPTYNYGNITNIMNLNLNFYYNETDYYSKQLWELTDAEISGYDPYSYTSQNITIKYNGFTISATVDNTNATTSGWEYSAIDDTTATLTKYNYGDDYPQKIYIPEKIDNYQITTLGSSSFVDSPSKVVVLPESIIKIGSKAFYGALLDTIELPANLQTISTSAFEETVNLEGITIPDNVTTLGESAFASSGIRSITIPNNITAINNETFSSCSNLIEVTLNNNITSIGEYAFSETTKLENISLPTNLAIIDKYAFYNSALTSIEIPNKVEKIGVDAFADCTYLSEVTLSEGITEIGSYAFMSTSISTIYIPKTVTTIGMNPFVKVTTLETINVDKDNPVYDSRTNNDSIVETATDKLITGISNTDLSTIKIIGSRSITTTATELVIPEGVTKIEDYVLLGCSYENFSKIVLPKSLTSISTNAFMTAYASKYYVPKNLVLWVYNDSYSKTYAIENSLTYKVMDPIDISVSLNKTEYKAFEQVDTTNLSITLYYDDNTTEIITNNYLIKYNNNNDSFRYQDTFFTITFTTTDGYDLEVKVPVTVSKATPSYTVPTNITGKVGQQLSEIILPDNFSWMNEEETLSETGTKIYKAKYIPTDTTNYETVENIDISILVTATTALNNTQDYECVYDGKPHTITIDVDLDNYEIKYSINDFSYSLEELPTFTEVGQYTINYKITSAGYEDILGSNKVNIYGIKDFGNSVVRVTNNIIILANTDPSFSNMINNLDIYSKSKTFTHYDRNDLVVSYDTTKTGDKFGLTLNNTASLKYYLAVTGDTNGDGKISALDYVRIKNHIMETNKITDEVFIAATDANMDNKISALDYVRIKNIIMEGVNS